MRTTFYKVAAYGTLFLDAYLGLALVATGMMPREGHQYLPPFGFAGVAAPPRNFVLLIITWTALLAVGCLGANSKPLQRVPFAVVFWVLLLLAVIWLAFVLPYLVEGFDFARKLFWHLN
jgi:hypothetical protein